MLFSRLKSTGAAGANEKSEDFSLKDNKIQGSQQIKLLISFGWLNRSKLRLKSKPIRGMCVAIWPWNNCNKLFYDINSKGRDEWKIEIEFMCKTASSPFESCACYVKSSSISGLSCLILEFTLNF